MSPSDTATRSTGTRRKAAIGRNFAGDELEQHLRAFIRTARPGQPLASERALARRYTIGYGTVRRVVQHLADEGLVEKVQGRGMFVRANHSSLGVKRGVVELFHFWLQEDHPYCMRRLQALLEGMETMGLRLEIRKVELSDHAAYHRLLLQEAGRGDLAGLIAPRLTHELIRAIREVNPGLPLVTCGHPQESIPPGVASVGHDLFSMGRLAGTHLCSLGARRILAAVKHRGIVPGLEAAFSRVASPPALELFCFDPLDPPAPVVNRLQEWGADSVFFADDRFARGAIDLMLRDSAALAYKLHLVSAANAGEQYLPPWVARLEIDGYEDGTVCASLLRGMLEGRPVNPLVSIQPRLVVPKTHAGCARRETTEDRETG